MKQTTTRSLVLCALCAAITCVLAPLAIPMQPVPISLATFAVALSGALLGAKWGAASQVVYLALGAIGLPVFAGYSSGIGVFSGPTGGYLVGYILFAWLTGLIYARFGRKQSYGKKTAVLLVALIAGLIGCYLLGSIWFMISTGSGIATTLLACVVPFLIGDCIKIAAVTLLVPQLERALSLTVRRKEA